MNAKEVHATLRPILGSWFKSNGFSALPRTPSAWYEEFDCGYRVVRVYLDTHFGYLPYFGGRLFLRAWCSTSVAGSPDASDRVLSLLETLSMESKRRLRDVNDGVVQRILSGLRSASLEAPILESMRASLQSELDAPFDGYIDGLFYLDPNDVRRWTLVITDILPEIVKSIPDF